MSADTTCGTDGSWNSSRLAPTQTIEPRVRATWPKPPEETQNDRCNCTGGNLNCFVWGEWRGGIRTPDLWVMSPTSCRCSTPRRGRSPRSGGLDLDDPTGLRPQTVGRCRGRGVPAAASPPTESLLQYSPALRRVTTGFGMGPGGATALSATGTPPPPHLVSSSVGAPSGHPWSSFSVSCCR